MTALRRRVAKTLGGTAAALALVLAMPAAAQDSDAPVDVTAAPPPSTETIGPAQLRNFDLQGRVTRPADRPATTPAQPATTVAATPRSGEAVPAEAAATPAGGTSPLARPPSGQQTVDDRPTAVSSVTADPRPITPSLPLEVTTGPAPQPGFDEGSLSATVPIDRTGDSLPWPWILALLALIGGGAFIAWGMSEVISRAVWRNAEAGAGR